jgi:hypothetical protein
MDARAGVLGGVALIAMVGAALVTWRVLHRRRVRAAAGSSDGESPYAKGGLPFGGAKGFHGGAWPHLL